MPWLPKQSVVVPVDFSDEAFAALEMARDNMVATAEAIHVIYVLPPLIPEEPGVIWAMVDDQVRSEHAEKAMRERLKDAKYAGVSIEIRIGDPSKAIAAFAQDKHAELVVIPSHGRTGISRLLIGSVAERVVRLAHCPVLVLRN